MASASPFRSVSAQAAVFASYDQLLERWPCPHESQRVETKLGTAHVLVCGSSSSPPLLLLHGGGGNATMWIHNVAILASTFRVLAVDIAGDVGKSEGARPASEEHYVAWLDEVIVGLRLGATNLAGASFGAWLAAAYQRRHPAKVSKLALLAPPNLAPIRPAFLMRALIATIAPTEARVQKFYRYISSPAAPAPPPWALQEMYVRWRSQKQGIAPPKTMTNAQMRLLPERALVLLGVDEVLYDLNRAVQRLRENAPQIALEVLQDAGHTLSVDRADHVSRALQQYFQS